MRFLVSKGIDDSIRNSLGQTAWDLGVHVGIQHEFLVDIKTERPTSIPYSLNIKSDVGGLLVAREKHVANARELVEATELSVLLAVRVGGSERPGLSSVVHTSITSINGGGKEKKDGRKFSLLGGFRGNSTTSMTNSNSPDGASSLDEANVSPSKRWYDK